MVYSCRILDASLAQFSPQGLSGLLIQAVGMNIRVSKVDSVLIERLIVTTKLYLLNGVEYMLIATNNTHSSQFHLACAISWTRHTMSLIFSAFSLTFESGNFFMRDISLPDYQLSSGKVL